MAKQFLDSPDIVASLQELGGKGVTQGVAADPLGNARLDGSIPRLSHLLPL